MNNFWNRVGNDEQYTTKSGVELILPYIQHLKDKLFWLPFDMPESQFCKVLAENGFKFVNSHIWMGGLWFLHLWARGVGCNAI